MVEVEHCSYGLLVDDSSKTSYIKTLLRSGHLFLQHGKNTRRVDGNRTMNKHNGTNVRTKTINETKEKMKSYGIN
jgi:predicted RNA-binding protein with PUA domain